MSTPIKVYVCVCGAQEEGPDEPPKCWLCGGVMRLWQTRMPFRFEGPSK